MPQLAGDDRQKFVDVLEEGARFAGYVVYEKDARADVGAHLGGWSEQGLTQELLAYAQSGGKISRNAEQRENWRDKWKYCIPFKLALFSPRKRPGRISNYNQALKPRLK